VDPQDQAGAAEVSRTVAGSPVTAPRVLVPELTFTDIRLTVHDLPDNFNTFLSKEAPWPPVSVRTVKAVLPGVPKVSLMSLNLTYTGCPFLNF